MILSKCELCTLYTCLDRVVGCANKYWTEDLLLLSRDLLREVGQVGHLDGQYEIQVIEDESDMLILDTKVTDNGPLYGI